MPLPSFNAVRVLVVGDVMLDRYWFGHSARLSPEAPVPIVCRKKFEERPGGAGNVAYNLAAVGAQVDLLGFCGHDLIADTLEQTLTAAGVCCHLQRLANITTTTKLRVLSQHQQLIRLDCEDQVPVAEAQRLRTPFLQQLSHADVVIFSDYNKGSLDDIQTLIHLARQAGKVVLVDPKRSDFNHYRGATILTPNRQELEAAIGVCSNEHILIDKAKPLLPAYDLQALLVTLGERGMILINRDGSSSYLPAHVQTVYDITGAGDTVIALFALMYAAQADLVYAAQVANAAAGIVVTKLGTSTVSVVELEYALQTQGTAGSPVIITEELLQVIVAQARVKGERIVMTGGCFDIVHAGHVAYLGQAKAFGERLVVAVNDDATVAQLKGPGRPINSLENRMALLAGLRMVDWVIAFRELTPEHLIKRISPDIWVKGGDYQLSDLPETEVVLALGGQVKLVKFIDGCSTRLIIQKIQQMPDAVKIT